MSVCYHSHRQQTDIHHRLLNSLCKLMDYYFCVNKDTLLIHASGPEGPECIFEGQDSCVKVVSNINQLKAKAVRNEDDSISIIENPDLSGLYVDLRDRRDKLLSESDWTQGNDSPLSPEKKEEWTVYRQALRDLPNTVTDPTNVTWPTPP